MHDEAVAFAVAYYAFQDFAAAFETAVDVRTRIASAIDSRLPGSYETSHMPGYAEPVINALILQGFERMTQRDPYGDASQVTRVFSFSPKAYFLAANLASNSLMSLLKVISE